MIKSLNAVIPPSRCCVLSCVFLWRWIFHKRNENKKQLIHHGQIPSAKLRLPVSCSDSRWSLQSAPVVLSDLRGPGQPWHPASGPSNAGLLITDGISAHVCRHLPDIRQSCWVARAPHCPYSPYSPAIAKVCAADWPKPVSGILWIPAAVPDPGRWGEEVATGMIRFI